MLFNADLVDDLARQKVVLFLGAGVSSSAATRAGSPMKGWSAFLNEACRNIDPLIAAEVSQLVADKDYLLACEILQTVHAEEWPNLVMAEYGQSAEPSPLHRALVLLDQRIILTTNFDKLLEAVWDNKFGNASHYPIVINGIPDKAFGILKDHGRRYIIKIHGTIDDAENVVFSRSQYVKSAFANPSYIGFLDNLLLNYTFLFVGFSMDDPAIISLMENYAFKYPKARPHYIFVPDGKSQRIIDINKRLRKLVSLSYDASNHHERLPQHIEDLAEQMNRRRGELYTEMKSSAV